MMGVLQEITCVFSANRRRRGGTLLSRGRRVAPHRVAVLRPAGWMPTDSAWDRRSRSRCRRTRRIRSSPSLATPVRWYAETCPWLCARPVALGVAQGALKSPLRERNREVAAGAFQDAAELVGGPPEAAGDRVGEVDGDEDVVDLVHDL